MGHGQSDESNGATEGCGRGGEQSDKEKQHVAQPSGGYAHALGILRTQLDDIQWFDEQQASREAHQSDGRKGGHQCHRNPTEVPQAPNHKTPNALLGGKIVEQRDHRRGHIAHHHTDDEQHEAMAHDGREEEDDRRHGHGPDESCPDDGHKTRPRKECRTHAASPE